MKRSYLLIAAVILSMSGLLITAPTLSQAQDKTGKQAGDKPKTKRPARKGRNPRTGEQIRIKASKVLKFKPAAKLKKAAGT